MKYTTLLMDADDTIFDFPSCEYNALRETLKFYGLKFNDEIYQSFSFINSALWKKFEINKITRAELRIKRFSELIEKCFDGADNSVMLADKYVEQLAEQAIFINGAQQTLEHLSKYRDIYIITNGLKTVQYKRIEKSGLYNYIKGVFISDELGVQKPMKEFFDIVLKNIDEKDTSKILVVGDSLTSDMKGGKNAGLATCLYDPKNKTKMPNELCDYKITDLKELIDF